MWFLLARIAPVVAYAFFNIGLAGAQTGVIQPDRAQSERSDTRHPALPGFTMQERATIYSAVMSEMKERPIAPVPLDVKVEVGTTLPETAELHPLPDALRAKIPLAKNYDYAIWNRQVLLVDPSKRTVADMLHDYILRDYIPRE